MTTAWLGWVVFIGILLCAAGLINAVQGLVAVFDDGFYRASTSALVVDVDYVVWGWALLIFGITLLFAGAGVVLGYRWARVVGVVVASINALVNLGFATAYPTWTILAVCFDVSAIYALIVHGGAARALRVGRK
ncbi:DUF7144 family membrane protein [Couchioplanes caeruleus]|uniref:DUF7144 domain-containing protein n=1 Tax=Couchioplanes caeruleus TaxID=56438 RepID=A0A3N1GEL1_9ACTN|nr:hypothetical protein [Couchioplanes caeruleus]ROP28752.1 hypothetical protein EDD30_1524 [Couchioplanes caeruleus]